MMYRPEQVAKITNTRNIHINNKAQSSEVQIDNTWSWAQAKNQPHDLIGKGMLFHSVGAATATAQSPLSLSLDCGIARNLKSADLGDLEVK